jgi:hypothetical protein
VLKKKKKERKKEGEDIVNYKTSQYPKVEQFEQQQIIQYRILTQSMKEIYINPN